LAKQIPAPAKSRAGPLDPVAGMLEHATLLLRPPDASAVQTVVDPTTGAPLGFVRRRPGGVWERWFGGGVLDVREQEDASLLCTIRRGWLRPQCRLVYDADGLGVGMVLGRRLEDRHGRLVAVRRPDAFGRGDVFRDPAGAPLATLRPGRDGLAVAFTEAATTDPFTRMLVLAAALQG
jgi:hypothetical protein